MSKVIAVVGSSQTGKTRFIERLVPELKKRGRNVAVIKHCPHGFLFDVESKDSHRFFQAGADGVAMAGPEMTAVVRRLSGSIDLRLIARTYFADADIVLVEGGKGLAGLPQMELLRKGISEEPSSTSTEWSVLLADFAAKSDKPVLDVENIPAVADFLEKAPWDEMEDVILEIDGSQVPIKDFVRAFMKNSILGMIRALRGVKESPRHVRISILQTKDRDENP